MTAAAYARGGKHVRREGGEHTQEQARNQKSAGASAGDLGGQWKSTRKGPAENGTETHSASSDNALYQANGEY